MNFANSLRVGIDQIKATKGLLASRHLNPIILVQLVGWNKLGIEKKSKNWFVQEKWDCGPTRDYCMQYLNYANNLDEPKDNYWD